MDQARRSGMTGPKKNSKSLSRFNRCMCHPQQWGMKKGLRRGRRRLDKLVIAEQLRECPS